MYRQLTKLIKFHAMQSYHALRWIVEQHEASKMYCNNVLVQKGLRVAMGMATGQCLKMKPCARTGRAEYFGPLLNHAARIAQAAHGGQVRLEHISKCRYPEVDTKQCIICYDTI